MIRVVTVADDFGLNDAVDAAVSEFGERGVLTATSCMVLGPRWSRAAAEARRLRQWLDVGLHLDLTEFGAADGLGSLVLRSQLRLLSVPALRLRIRAQLQRFEDDVGAPPDYLDGHQHVHQFPRVAEALLEELRGRPASCAPWLRVSRPPPGAGFKERLLGRLAAPGFVRDIAATGRRTTGALLGVYGFDLDSSGFAALLERMLTQARDGDALMLHPGTTAMAGDPIGTARVVEYTVLRDAAFDALCRRLGIVRTRGSALIAAGAGGRP